MSSPRVRKIADRIKVVVAEMLERRVKDPRLGFVTVTDVRVSGDSQHASVFYTVLGEEEQAAGSAAALESAKGLIRSEVGKQLGIRHVPTIEFIRDALPETARHLEVLLEQVRQADAAAAAASAGAVFAGEADPYRKPRVDDDEERRLRRPRVSRRRPDGGPSGLVVVDKPGGMTSHDVVARVRRLVGTRRVGHAGTLDPMATGVLLLGVNKGTRLLGHLALAEKTYRATVRLGVATTTDDAEGEVVARADASAVDEAALLAAVARLTGDIEQVPSAVSAIKVDGRRAYALVRAGATVELRARPVTVHRFDVLTHRTGTPTGTDDSTDDGLPALDVDVEVHCTTGTYVRALARDLGADLGVGGHLTRLRRTAVGPVGLDGAADLEAALASGELDVVPLEDAVARFFGCHRLDADQARDVTFGRALALDLPADGPVAVLAPDGTFLALYRRADPDAVGGPRATPVAVFSSSPAG